MELEIGEKEIITIKRTITNEKRESLGKLKVKELLVIPYWEGDYGEEIVDTSGSFAPYTLTNVEVEFKKYSYTEFEKNWYYFELYINGELQEDYMNISSVKGNADRLVVRACWGAG